MDEVINISSVCSIPVTINEVQLGTFVSEALNNPYIFPVISILKQRKVLRNMDVMTLVLLSLRITLFLAPEIIPLGMNLLNTSGLRDTYR